MSNFVVLLKTPESKASLDRIAARITNGDFMLAADQAEFMSAVADSFESQAALRDELAEALRGMLDVSGFGRGFDAVVLAEKRARAAIAKAEAAKS